MQLQSRCHQQCVDGIGRVSQPVEHLALAPCDFGTTFLHLETRVLDFLEVPEPVRPEALGRTVLFRFIFAIDMLGMLGDVAFFRHETLKFPALRLQRRIVAGVAEAGEVCRRQLSA